MMRLNLLHLQMIEAVHRLGSITAAAQSMYLTQSAITHALKKFEAQYGIKIWELEGRRVRFTQAGVYLIKTAQRILPQVSAIEANLVQYAQGGKGQLRIGVECHPCYEWLLKVIMPYFKAYPKIHVDVQQKFSTGGMAALFNHEIDVLVTPDPLHTKGVYFYPVFDYEQILAMHRTHPLAGNPYISAETLSNQTLITYPVEIERLDIFSQFLQPNGCSPKLHQTIETTEIMLEMVHANKGIAALPKWLLQTHLAKYANVHALELDASSQPLKLASDITYSRIGEAGIFKQIHLGVRQADTRVEYIEGLIHLARLTNI